MKILLSSNMRIVKKYVKENAKIGFIPTASELDNNRYYMEESRNNLKEMNFNIIDIENSRESKKGILNKYNNIDTIFVAGGNCFYLLQQLKKKDILQDLTEFANNRIYIGSSAGACITCPSIDYAEKLDNKKEAPLLNDYNGMDLINGYILPHYNSKEKYTKLANEIIEEHPNLNFITLTNQEAIIVNTRNDYTIVNTD